MLYKGMMDVYYVNLMKPMNLLPGQNTVFVVKPGGIYNTTGNVRIT